MSIHDDIQQTLEDGQVARRLAGLPASKKLWLYPDMKKRVNSRLAFLNNVMDITDRKRNPTPRMPTYHNN